MTYIRIFKEADRASVFELWEKVFEVTRAHHDFNLSINRKLKYQSELFFVALEGVPEDGLVVGSLMAGFDGHRGWIYSLATDPEYRGRGIARKLVERAERVLKDLDCPKVNLQIMADNKSVIGFYESLGYNVEERISMGKVLPD